jgi:hypothetical protein
MKGPPNEHLTFRFILSATLRSNLVTIFKSLPNVIYALEYKKYRAALLGAISMDLRAGSARYTVKSSLAKASVGKIVLICVSHRTVTYEGQHHFAVLSRSIMVSAALLARIVSSRLETTLI